MSLISKSARVLANHRAMSIASGALIAAAGFTLLLSALAWFMPKFLGFVDSRWAPLLPALSVLLICASELVRYLLKRRA
jgi:hypothetical protein